MKIYRRVKIPKGWILDEGVDKPNILPSGRYMSMQCQQLDLESVPMYCAHSYLTLVFSKELKKRFSYIGSYHLFLSEEKREGICTLEELYLLTVKGRKEWLERLKERNIDLQAYSKKQIEDLIDDPFTINEKFPDLVWGFYNNDRDRVICHLELYVESISLGNLLKRELSILKKNENTQKSKKSKTA